MEAIIQSLQGAADQARRVSGTAWGAAIGGLIAIITEGARFVKNEADRLDRRLEGLDSRITAVEAKVPATATPISPVAPGTPTVAPSPAFVAALGSVSFASSGGPHTDFRCRITATVAAGGGFAGPGGVFATLTFGKQFVVPPRVLIQQYGNNLATRIVQPSLPGTASVDLNINELAASATVTFDVIVEGQQVG